MYFIIVTQGKEGFLGEERLLKKWQYFTHVVTIVFNLLPIPIALKIPGITGSSLVALVLV
jgi:hypothetical protein